MSRYNNILKKLILLFPLLILMSGCVHNRNHRRIVIDESNKDKPLTQKEFEALIDQLLREAEAEQAAKQYSGITASSSS